MKKYLPRKRNMFAITLLCAVVCYIVITGKTVAKFTDFGFHL